MNATDFYRDCRKDKKFKESIDAVRGQAVIDFAEAYHKQAQSTHTRQITDEEIQEEAYKRYPLQRDGLSEAAIRAGKLRAFIECGEWMRDQSLPTTREGESEDNPEFPISRMLSNQNSEWIECSDRLPEKEDADEDGEILALFEDDLELTVQYNDSGLGGVIIKWKPLVDQG